MKKTSHSWNETPFYRRWGSFDFSKMMGNDASMMQKPVDGVVEGKTIMFMVVSKQWYVSFLG